MYPWVRSYIGIPFVSGGRDKSGCDCYGLIRLILSTEYSIRLPALANDYKNALDMSETKRLFDAYLPILTAREIGSPEEGSVILIREKGFVSHVGIYAGDDFILHTTLHTGSVVERLSSPSIKGRIEGFYACESDHLGQSIQLER